MVVDGQPNVRTCVTPVREGVPFAAAPAPGTAHRAWDDCIPRRVLR